MPSGWMKWLRYRRQVWLDEIIIMPPCQRGTGAQQYRGEHRHGRHLGGWNRRARLHLNLFGGIIAVAGAYDTEDQQYGDIEAPAIHDMVCTGAVLIVRQVRQYDDADTAQSISDQRYRHAGQQKQHGFVDLPKHQVGEQDAEGHRRDQKAQARTGFGYLKPAICEFEGCSFGIMDDAQDIEAHIDEVCRKILHW